MEQSTIKEQFKKFAQERLLNHLGEINTRYENEKPDSGERAEALKAHRNIFEEELKNKINELHPDSHEGMKRLKSEYLGKLK